MRFNSDDFLPLNKTIETPGTPDMIIVAKDAFHENSNYYPDVFSEPCL